METKPSARGLVTIAIIAVVGLLLGAIFMSLTSSPDPAEETWSIATTTGPEDARLHYIMYTDLMCPYCDVFSREIMNHWDEFQSYLDEHKILFEVRVTDLLYTGGSSDYSRTAGEAAYCATRADHFWEFYHAALASLWSDYQSKGIGSSKTALPITNMPDDYWLKVGASAGLDEDFANCLKNHEAVDELDYNTRRASQVTTGLPSFKFHRFATSGFSDTWDWAYVKMMLDAGLK